MSKADEIRSWPKDKFGWYLSPGFTWCAKNNRVKLGNGVKLSDEVTLGNGVTLGDEVTLGNWVKLGNGVTLGDEVTLGDGVTLSDEVTLGNGVTLGDEVTLVTGTTYARDLGVQSGYRHALTIVNGELRFVGGCHTFSFSEAREYWANNPNRVETLAAVDFAEKLAALIPECAPLLEDLR